MGLIFLESSLSPFPLRNLFTGDLVMENNQPRPPLLPSAFPAQQPYHHLLQQLQQQLQSFWNLQREEMEHINDFKNHQLPLARIKKIMKADEDVHMISAETPILFSKACEFFILELTMRSWIHAEENRRGTLQKKDIAAAMTRTNIFDFLVDIVPREELGEEGSGMSELMGATASGVPYYHHHPMGQHAPPGVMMGRPALPGVDPGMYGQPPSQAWQSVWQQNPSDEVQYGSGSSKGTGNLDVQE